MFLISNAKKYKGAVQVIYDMDGKLSKVDFSGTDLQASDIEKMIKALSGHVDAIAVNFKSADTVIVEGEFEVSFDDFIREYGYKRNTHLAREYWSKMKKEDQALAFVAAGLYRKYCEREQVWYKPKIAVAWLKMKEYLNDWKNL